MSLSLDLLRDWPEAWRIPELWSALCRRLPTLPAEHLAQALVRRHAHPSIPTQVFHELAEQGEFAASERLLDHPAFLLALGAPVDSLREALAKAQAVQLRQFDDRAALLRPRALRLRVDAALIQDRLERARAAAAVRRRDAVELLEQFEAELEEREQATQPLGLASAYAEQVHAPRWPFDDPAEDVCHWFLAAADLCPGRFPAGFAERWATHDGVCLALITALREVLTKPPTAERVIALALELDRFLGAPPTPPPRVENQGGVFQTFLRGLPPLVPALSPSLYPDGVPLLVSAGVLPEIERLATPLGVVLAIRPAPYPDRLLRLHPEHLFPLLRRGEHRTMDLLRILCAQIPPGWILPRVPPMPDAVALRGRDGALRVLRETPGPVLLCGAEGMGRTALLCRFAEERLRDGWSVVWVESAAGPGAVVPRLSELLPAEPGARRVVLMDTPHNESLADLLRWNDGDLVLSWTPSLSPPPEAGAIWRELPLLPLADDAVHELLTALFDVLGIRLASPSLTDRLVFWSGGHPALLFYLLAELFDRQAIEIGRRRVTVAEQDIDAAWCSPCFRAAATRLLIAPLEQQPAVLIPLLSLLFLAEGTAQEVAESELGELVPASHRHMLSEALTVLARRGLVHRVAGPTPTVARAQSGLGVLVAELLSDPLGLLDEYTKT